MTQSMSNDIIIIIGIQWNWPVLLLLTIVCVNQPLIIPMTS